MSTKGKTMTEFHIFTKKMRFKSENEVEKSILTVPKAFQAKQDTLRGQFTASYVTSVTERLKS